MLVLGASGSSAQRSRVKRGVHNRSGDLYGYLTHLLHAHVPFLRKTNQFLQPGPACRKKNPSPGFHEFEEFRKSRFFVIVLRFYHELALVFCLVFASCFKERPVEGHEGKLAQCTSHNRRHGEGSWSCATSALSTLHHATPLATAPTRVSQGHPPQWQLLATSAPAAQHSKRRRRSYGPWSYGF